MRIEKLNINGFGVFADLQVDGFAPGLNVFVGENEAGKSTCLEFIRNCLFGAPTGQGSKETPKYPVPAGAKPGGSLQLGLSDGKQWELFWQPKTGMGIQTLFEIDSSGSTQIDLDNYKQLYAEMTRQLYASVYGFSLTQLQNLSSLKDDARVSALLYGAGFGLGDISLPEIMKNLSEKQMGRIWRDRGQGQELNILLSSLKDIEQKIQAKQGHLPRFRAIKNELGEVQAKLKAHQAELSLARTNHDLNRDLIKLKNRLPELATVKAELEKLCPVQLSPEAEGLFSKHSFEKFETLAKNEKNHQDKLNEISQEQAKLGQGLSQTPAPGTALSVQAEIKSLQEEKSLYQANKEEISKLNLKLESIYDRQTFNGSISDNTKNKEQLDSQLQSLRLAWQELSPILTGWQLIKQSLEATTSTSTISSQKSLFNPSNPAMLLLGLGSTTALAFGLYNSIFFGSLWVWAGLFVCWIGLGALFVACRNLQGKQGYQLELRQTQEQKLDELLLKARPLINQLKPLLEKAGVDISADEQAQEDLLLSSMEAMTPAKCIAIENILLEWRSLLPLLEQLEELERTLIGLDQKSQELLNRVCPDQTQANSVTQSYLANLEILSQALSHATNQAQATQVWEGKAKGRLEALSAQHKELMRVLEETKKELETAFIASKTNNLEQLKTLYTSWEKQRKLAEQEKDLFQMLLLAASEVIDRATKTRSTIPAQINETDSLLAWLEDMEISSLNEAQEELEQNMKKLENLNQQLAGEEGSLGQEANTLMSDDELETLVLEREMLKEEANELARQWSVASLALHFLTEAKKSFEAKHQTAVMKEASALFSEITDGAYLGLDPSSEENSFAVLTKSGESRHPKELSRGTCEQLYLALRLALIKNRAETAEPLPLVMDDVLVNFDPSRLRRAVDTILTLARTHQILYFTCQPHLVPELIERASINKVESRLFKLKNGVISSA